MDSPEVDIFDIKTSGGPAAEVGDVVTMLYILALSREHLENKEWIESTYQPDEPWQVVLDEEHLLPGVLRATLGMRAGGSMRVARIPAEMAYGDRGTEEIPPGSDLWIEIRLGVVRKPT